MSNLMSRVLVAAVGIPVVLGAIYLGGWVLGALVSVVAALAVREFYALGAGRGLRPFTLLGTAAASVVVLLATAYPTPLEAALPVAGTVLLVTLLALAAAVRLRWPEGEPLAEVSVTVAGVVYVGCTLAFVPILRWLPATAPGALTGNRWDAAAFLLLPLAATWAGDTAAYFAGRAWGRTKLIPSVSPGKTVVGALAGLAASSGAAMVVAWWALAPLPFLAVSVPTAAWIGALLGAAAQIGDLVVSVLKREAGAKDSGRLLAGHGGVLDRIDALLFTIPLTWVLLAVGGVLP